MHVHESVILLRVLILCGHHINSSYRDSKDKQRRVTYESICEMGKNNFGTTWGPQVFDKTNHPLAIMVYSQ